MKKVYGICSGEYSDWDIHHMFKSEEKRDAVLKKLNECREYDDYDKVDYELDDDNFNLDMIKDINYVECTYDGVNFDFKIKKGNTLLKDESDFNYLRFSTFKNFNIIISRVVKEKDLQDEIKLRERYLKICRDYHAKGKYMYEVEGIKIYDIAQYENPIDSESLSEKISEDVYNSVYNKMITEEELDNLNELWDTGIEWDIM